MVTFGCVKRLAGASFVRATFHRLYATGTMSSHQVHLPVSETSHLRAGNEQTMKASWFNLSFVNVWAII